MPDGKILFPGVIDSVTNFVEHPDLVAERIMRFANVVGKENVIASTDCGFGTAARSAMRVHPSIVWAKLRTLAEGARRLGTPLGARPRRGLKRSAHGVALERASEARRAASR